MTPSQYFSHIFRKWWKLRHQPIAGILFAWSLCWWSTGLIVASAPVTGNREKTVNLTDPDYPKERWLADPAFYDDDQQLHLADADPLMTDSNSELCPRVPGELPADSCDVGQCSSDDECAGRHLKCCYNGCVYTCLPEIRPAPYIDWIREPKRRLPFGTSWLIPGSDDSVDAEMCSTSSLEDDDADPLVCPHGFKCRIDDPGKPEAGIPNIGHCVKVMDVRHLAGNSKLQPKSDPGQMLQADAPYSSFPVGENCLLGYGGLMLLAGHSVTKDGRECFCVKSELKCGQKGVPPK